MSTCMSIKQFSNNLFLAEVCKEKLNFLLDSYEREKNREKELSRSGGLTNHKSWKYAALMGFLAPFLEVEQTARQRARIPCQ